MSTICIVGLGYIGLPVASMLASRGHNVVGYDVNSVAVDSVNKGQAHFFEPDLDMLLKAAVNTGNSRRAPHPSRPTITSLPFRRRFVPTTSLISAMSTQQPNQSHRSSRQDLPSSLSSPRRLARPNALPSNSPPRAPT